MTRRLTPALVLGAFVCVLTLASLLSGCWNPFSSDSDDNRDREPALSLVPRTTPENVLHDFKSIYAGADMLVKTNDDAIHWAGMFRTLFHPDSFKFYFVPGDAPLGFPEGWWGLDPEVSTFESMLKRNATGEIEDISLSWTVGLSQPDPRPEHHGSMYIYVTGILVDVVEGDITHRVLNGAADFYFLPDPADSTLWVVSEWYDHESGAGSPPGRQSLDGVASSWGMLKALFYPEYGLR